MTLAFPGGDVDVSGFRAGEGPTQTTLTSESYRVKYYADGRGVRVATFLDRDEAADFAARNRLHAKPCKVEVVSV